MISAVAAQSADPIQITIGKGKTVTVRIPTIARGDMRDILSTFFSKDIPEQKARLDAILQQSGDITLILTTSK